MLDYVIFAIRSMSSALGVILGIQIPVSDGITIQFVDIVLFIFILFAFLKFFSIVTHRSTYSKRG